METQNTELKEKKEKLSTDITEIENLSKEDNNHILRKEKELKNLEINLTKANMKLDNLLLSLSEEYNMTYEKASLNYSDTILDNEVREKVTNLKNEIKSIGFVNVDAISEYKKVSERYMF